MKDPTYGRIDPDIQQMVEEWGPKDLAQRVAVENTMQAHRNAGRHEDGPFRTPMYVIIDVRQPDATTCPGCRVAVPLGQFCACPMRWKG